MIAVGALTLLVLSTAEGWSSTLYVGSQGRSNTLPLFLSQSSTTVYDAQPTVTTMTSHHSRSRRDSRIIKVPTVDSTLLRFLSTQKRRMIVHLRPNLTSSRSPSSLRMDDNPASISSLYSTSSSNSWEQKRKPSSNLSLSSRYLDNLVSTVPHSTSLNQSLPIPPTTTSTTSTSNNNIGDSISLLDPRNFSAWYDQTMTSSSPFCADRIAQRLVDMGAPTALAYQAGLSVQNHASIMTTRLNVLQYLRDRSAIWKANVDASSVDDRSNLEMNKKMLKPHAETYDTDQVLDLLEETGFTGKDIASIFVHTPTIARMIAKSKGIESMGNTTTLQDTIQQTYFGLLCEVLKLRKCDARKVRY